MIDDLVTGTWLDAESRRLLDFPQGPLPPNGGAYWLDDRGYPLRDEPIRTWITARTLYVYSLAAVGGFDHPRDRADAALRGLAGPLHDTVHGGWREAASETAHEKTAYAHASVLLATTAAVRAGLPAHDLFREAVTVIDRHLWDERHGMSRDTLSTDWSSSSPYRGLNANMHLVEAFLAVPPDDAGDLTDRAIGICRRVARWAAENDGRLPEHFDEDWNPLREFGAERPDDPFKPYGATPGHGFEWARLLVGAATVARPADRGWLTDAATSLYARAASDGWARNGLPGFVYTVDWSGRPVVDTHLFWVAAEAVSAAEVLLRATGDPRYERDRELWWRYISEHVVDRENGSWIPELDARNARSQTIWRGKPDLYHAFQACLISGLPVAASVLEATERARG